MRTHAADIHDGRSKCSNQGGYIDARPLTAARRNHFATRAGPYIWVKMRNTRKEQIISASPLSTDIIKHERHVGKVPEAEFAAKPDDFGVPIVSSHERRSNQL